MKPYHPMCCATLLDAAQPNNEHVAIGPECALYVHIHEMHALPIQIIPMLFVSLRADKSHDFLHVCLHAQRIARRGADSVRFLPLWRLTVYKDL